MLLISFRQNLSRDTVLRDQTQKKGMLALDVFSSAIGYITSHVMGTLGQVKSRIAESEITWVLTIPAIWEDKARQFMREAAEKVRMP